MPGGDFSALLAINANTYQISDPLTTTPAANGRFQRQPFPGNIIPQNRLDPTGLALVNLYPPRNVPATTARRYIAHKQALGRSFECATRVRADVDILLSRMGATPPQDPTAETFT